MEIGGEPSSEYLSFSRLSRGLSALWSSVSLAGLHLFVAPPPSRH